LITPRTVSSARWLPMPWTTSTAVRLWTLSRSVSVTVMAIILSNMKKEILHSTQLQNETQDVLLLPRVASPFGCDRRLHWARHAPCCGDARGRRPAFCQSANVLEGWV